jgi:hypothetical protein
MDLGFGTGMPENLYSELLPKNVILTCLQLILSFVNAYNGRNKDSTPIFMLSPKNLLYSQIQYGGRQTGSTYILVCLQDNNEIPMATPLAVYYAAV